MLQIVRKYTQGWVATLMGIILSFAFILWGVENYLSGSSKKNVIAKVNHTEITASEWEIDIQRMMSNLKDQLGSQFVIPPIMQQQIKSQALTNLIMENVLTQAALKAGFIVTPQQASASIKQMPIFQQENRFSRERFNLIIQKMGYTQPEFFNDVTKTLLMNQLASGIVDTEFVLPQEEDQAIVLLEQKRDIEYAIIPSAKFRSQIHPTPDQIQIYYQNHRDKFKTPASLQIESLLLSIDGLKKNLKVSDRELNDYLTTNHLNQKDPVIVGKAKETLLQQKLEQAFLAASDKLTDLIFTHPDSLSNAANELSLKVQTSEVFSEKGGSTPLTKHPKVIATAFHSDILKDHTNSNLIELAPGKVVVIRVKNYQPEAIAPLKQVQEIIKQQIINSQAIVMAKQKGELLLQSLPNKKALHSLLGDQHLPGVVKRHVSRHEKNVPTEILQIAYNISPSSNKPIQMAALSNGDTALVFVSNKFDLSPTSITLPQREKMRDLYSAAYGKLMYNLYVQHQMTKAKIKTYSTLKQVSE